MTTSARDALWLLFILITVGVVYSMSGRGTNFLNLGSGPRLSPSGLSKTTYELKSIFGDSGQIKESGTEKTISRDANQITISVQAAQNTDPQKEYITIRNSGSLDINLGGTEIKNKDDIAAKIENDENEKPIILRPKDTAYIFTGKSTRGANFKVNKCSGYFNQFHQFTPPISGRCPNIDDLPETKNLDDMCIEYLPKIRSCQMPTSLPTNLGSNCQNFIQLHANYQGCVADHKNDKDFDPPTGGGEWRIFLNRTTEFWAKRNETIKLVDSSGKIMTEANY